MNAIEKAMIDDLARKAFQSIVDEVPGKDAPREAAYRIPAAIRTAKETKAPDSRRAQPMIDPFALIACALALVLLIPPALGKDRTTVADLATAAFESGAFEGSADLAAMAFALAGENVRASRDKTR